MSTRIQNWRDFEPYGIISLTGEADPYSMRLLCDITEQGKALLEEFFGGGVTLGLPPNWNSKGVGSILLSYGLFQELAMFIMFHKCQHYYAVLYPDGGVHGYGVNEMNEEKLDKMKEYIPGLNVRRNYNVEPGKNRNEHQFTGRTI